MKFIRIEGPAFWFLCYRCSKQTPSASLSEQPGPPGPPDDPLKFAAFRVPAKLGGWADLDGPPFLAYYCDPCKVIEEKQEAQRVADNRQQATDAQAEADDRYLHETVCYRCRRNSHLPPLVRARLCRVGGPNRKLDEAALRGEEVS